MKIKWGALVVDGRGKIGGQVASKNSSGAYMRNKVTPVNPSTVSQAGVRNLFKTLAQGWRSLTAAQRESWNSAVTAFKKTDIFGDGLAPSGFNLFMRLNGNLLNIGEAQIDTAPVAGTVNSVLTLAMTFDIGIGGVEAAYTPAIDADDTMILEATAPQSPGKNFVKSEYRKIATLETADATPYDFEADYIAKFGSLPAEGQKVFVRAKVVNNITGQASGYISDSGLVVDTA